MKKYSCMAAFFALLFSLAVSVAYACEPGCNCDTPAAEDPAGGDASNSPNASGSNGGVAGAINRHADAKRVEGKAQARQHVKMNDNGPGMTCFDRALAMTQNLGQIFSDIPLQNVVPRADDLFGPSSYPDMGVNNWLNDALNTVVVPVVQGHASNFADSLSAMLGATELFAMMDDFQSQLTGLINDFIAPINSLNTAMGTFNSFYSTLQTLMTALGAVMPAAVVGIVTMINTIWSQIQSFINTLLNTVMTAINTVFSTITGLISSIISAVMAEFNLDGACARIAQLWGNGFPGEFRSLIGSAIERGTPYFTMFEMLQNNLSDVVGQPGQDLMQEITNATNSDIINRALSDIMPGGMLAGPGSPDMPTWPAVPVFNPAADFNNAWDDVFTQMHLP